MTTNATSITLHPVPGGYIGHIQGTWKFRAQESVSLDFTPKTCHHCQKSIPFFQNHYRIVSPDKPWPGVAIHLDCIQGYAEVQ